MRAGVEDAIVADFASRVVCDLEALRRRRQATGTASAATGLGLRDRIRLPLQERDLGTVVGVGTHAVARQLVRCGLGWRRLECRHLIYVIGVAEVFGGTQPLGRRVDLTVAAARKPRRLSISVTARMYARLLLTSHTIIYNHFKQFYIILTLINIDCTSTVFSC